MSEQTFTLALTADDLDRVLRALDAGGRAISEEAREQPTADRFQCLAMEVDRMRRLRVRLAETRRADVIEEQL